MNLLRNLLVAFLAFAGALSWGPPTMLQVCLGRGGCAMSAPTRGDLPACCRRAPVKSGDAVNAGPASHGPCCGCCASVKVGQGLDGGTVPVETVVPPPARSDAVVAALPSTDAVPAAALRAAPRAPPERVLPLRI